MNTPPAHIYLKPDAVPFTRHSPIPVPDHWKDTIKESLDRDVQQGIIKKVDIGTLVEWCSPMVNCDEEGWHSQENYRFAEIECTVHEGNSPLSFAISIGLASPKKYIQDRN